MTDHRCRVEKVRAHTLIWNVTCYTCGDRYLTDGGWYDAMGHAGMHYYDNLVPPARRLRHAMHKARFFGERFDSAAGLLGDDTG